jgi:hypothetical protein
VRRALSVLLFAAALILVAACGDDAEPDSRPGSDGAFGGADDCSQLIDETVAARARVLDQLGDARRTDTERIDEALSAFGGDGPDLAVRYEGLGCDQSFEVAVCAAAEGLEAAGPAARDLVATWSASCA